MKKVAFFSRYPLGDGINSLVLSQQLYLNGLQVDTYHNTLGNMQHWFPHLPILRYPEIEEIPHLLDRYDFYIVVWDAKTEFITRLVAEAKRRFPEKIKVVYLYSSKNIVHEPYYADCLTDPSKSVAENFRMFCKRVLQLPKIERNTGWVIPEGLVFRKHSKRIVLHPTGSGPAGTNWPKSQFVKLAAYLRKLGYEVVFIPGFRDMEGWKDVDFERADFPTLDGLARYLYESGYLMGSDSGPGHLASALGIPTMTLCRRKTHADLWAPSFAPNITLTPHPLLPNIRWIRLRDRHWQKFITFGMARRGAKRLLALFI